jgi:hypothetical protein
MIRVLACCVLLFVVAGDCNAASFDLSSSVHGYGFSEVAIDLEQAFTRIDSAYLRFEGNYTPGILLGTNSTPPRTYAADDFHFLIRLDDPGTSWLDKSVYSHADMRGTTGEVAFELPLFDSHPPSFFPRTTLDPNYDFLLDGQFGMSVTSLLFTIPEDELIVPPVFDLARLSLEIDGVAVPEPSAVLTGCLLFLIASLGRRSRNNCRRVPECLLPPAPAGSRLPAG